MAEARRLRYSSRSRRGRPKAAVLPDPACEHDTLSTAQPVLRTAGLQAVAAATLLGLTGKGTSSTSRFLLVRGG